MLKFEIKNRRGTALLVAMLVMGVLISISLALSTLILRQTRITKDFLDSTKAYYAAESGIEIGLFGVKHELPGWQPGETDDSGFKYLKIDPDLASVGEYRVANRCQAYPCFADDYDLASAEPKAYYDVLDLNESITIPLFVVNDNGDQVPVKHFVVEFFAPFNPKEDLKIADPSLLSGWDVMRWKVFGIKSSPPKVTESISDFTALSMVNSVVGGDFAANATIPSWFGTDGCNSEVFGDRYNNRIGCGNYVIGGKNLQKINADDQGQIADIFAGNCLNTEAREYYEYRYNPVNNEKKLYAEDIHDCYLISAFLEQHELNYLTLTNLMNPAVFDLDKLNGRDPHLLSRLYFRVELAGDNGAAAYTSREVSTITANGYSGDSKQTIEVKIRKGSFMPVFNFSLYSTYKNKELETGPNGLGLWYEAEAAQDNPPSL